MNKNAIKKFAIEARQKLIASVTDKAGMLGITAEGVSAPTTKGNDFEVYQTAAGTEVTLNKKQCEQRRRLVEQIESKGFEEVVEEVAYTWFNRICAIRFMEVNDYLPSRVRALSSEKEGKNEPDLVTHAPDVELDLTDAEKEFVIESKMSGKLDELFAMLFVKQCNKLHEVLPELFEETSDYTEMLLSISFTNKDDVIRMLIDEVPEEDFNITTTDENGNVPGQVEIIGWLYQYYNTELKDDTFAKLKKNIKITKERIPAATQLFTPDWIVRYMVENSVGRLWIEHLRAVDPSVDEKKIAEEFGWKYYLPEAEQEESVNHQLLAIRAEYKDLTPEDITCIDPCMGSGHILVAMFDVLMDIYKSAGYSERDAALLIVQKNIYGLDIDKRAYQLAYFAVMMKGRQYNRRFLRCSENKIYPYVYAIKDSRNVNISHLQYFGKKMKEQDRTVAEAQIKRLIKDLENADENGTITNITEFNKALLDEFIGQYSIENQYDLYTVGIDKTQAILRILVQQAYVLTRKYDVVITNPPYMGSSGMDSQLSEYVKINYKLSKGDMSTVCMEKAMYMSKYGGYISMINIPVWMFITSYEEFREYLLSEKTFVNMVHPGRGVFGSDFGTVTFCVKNLACKNYIGTYYRLFNDQGEVKNNEERETAFNNRRGEYFFKQDKCFNIPGSPLCYWISDNFINVFKESNISKNASVKEGLKTGDNGRFIRYWYEVDIDTSNIRMDNDKAKWIYHTKGGDYRKWYGNKMEVVNFEQDGQELRAYKGASLSGYSDYFKTGITYNRISVTKTSFRYTGDNSIPNMAGLTIYPNKYEQIYYMLGWLNTNIVHDILGFINPTINFPPGTIGKIPYIVIDSIFTQVNNLVRDNVRIEKEEWDSYELSWDFRKHPLIGDFALISKAWDNWNNLAEKRIKNVKENETEINRLFAEALKLQNDVVYEIDQKDITLRCADKVQDVKTLISYAVGCMFGRYSLDNECIQSAGKKYENEAYVLYKPDPDNVIPITDEEYFEDDIVSRFVQWVRTAFGDVHLEENLNYIAGVLGYKGSGSRDIIRTYFINGFIQDHIKMYQKLPIYWMFDSGKEDGFKALIYMHRYTADTVGIVRTDYLHKTQKAIEQAMQREEYVSENALSASDKKKAVQKITKYTKQLAQMKSYDEAMAHIANQRIEIDLDDGVKLNYEKFQGVEVAQEGKKALKIDLLTKIK